MTTADKLKVLMRVRRLSIWELADTIQEKDNVLIDIVNGADHDDRDLETRITDMMLGSGLCPECGNTHYYAGGCKECFCGWSMC